MLDKKKIIGKYVLAARATKPLWQICLDLSFAKESRQATGFVLKSVCPVSLCESFKEKYSGMGKLYLDGADHRSSENCHQQKLISILVFPKSYG
jgi:hypothetical protein